MNENKSLFENTIANKSKSTMKNQIKKFEDLKMIKNPLSKLDSKIQKNYNLEKQSIRNSVLGITLSPEHYNIYKELHKIKGCDISLEKVEEIANLNLYSLNGDINKSKSDLNHSRLELAKLKKFYENFFNEEKDRETDIRSEIKWLNKTLHNRDINSIRYTTENLYSDIIDNINLINNRVQEDIENKKMQLHFKTENVLDFTILKNNDFLKKTLKSQEGMVKILYTFTQEMGKIRGNYENIRKRIKKFHEANFKFKCRIEEENLKIEKIKSDMMKYKIKINKIKTNVKTNDLKKILKNDKKKNKNISKNIIKSDEEFNDNHNTNIQHNQQKVKYINEHNTKISETTRNLKSAKIRYDGILPNKINQISVKQISSSSNFDYKLMNQDIDNNLNNPVFCEPIYQNAARKFIDYVFSTEENKKESDIKSVEIIKIKPFFNAKNSYDQKKTSYMNSKILFPVKNQDQLPEIVEDKTFFNKKFKPNKNLINRLKINSNLNLENNQDENDQSLQENKFIAVQKNSIINIIDNNPKIGNTVHYLTNTLSTYRNKLNKLLKEQTNLLFTKNKIKETVYKLIKKFKKEIQEDNNVLNFGKAIDTYKSTIKNNFQQNIDDINLVEFENIASERRKFIDFVVKDKDILLSFYDDKFPKINSINKKFNF